MNEARIGITVGAGVFDLMSNLEAKAPGYTFYLSGDLSQMAEQKDFLRGQFFDVGQSNVYPVLKPEDKERALRLIYKHKVPGWWHYEDEYVELGIATKEEFRARLHNQVDSEHKAEYDALPVCKVCGKKVRTIFFPTHVDEKLHEISHSDAGHEPEVA